MKTRFRYRILAVLCLIFASLFVVPTQANAQSSTNLEVPAVLEVTLAFDAPASTPAGQSIIVKVKITPTPGSCFDVAGVYIDVSPDNAIVSKSITPGFTVVANSEESTSSTFGATLSAPAKITEATEIMQFTITSNTAGTISGITVNGSGVNKSAAWCEGGFVSLTGVSFSTTVTSNAVSGKIVNDLTKPYGQDDAGDQPIQGAVIEFVDIESGNSAGVATTGSDGLYSVALPSVKTYAYVVEYPIQTPPFLPTTGIASNIGTVTVPPGGVTKNFYARKTTQSTATMGDLTSQVDSTGETATLVFEPTTGTSTQTVYTVASGQQTVAEIPNTTTGTAIITQPGRAAAYYQGSITGIDPASDVAFGFIQPCVSTDPYGRNKTQLSDLVAIIGEYNTSKSQYNPVFATYSPLVDGADISAAVSNYWTACQGNHPNPTTGGLRAKTSEFGPDNPAAQMRFVVKTPVQGASYIQPVQIDSTTVYDITISVFLKSHTPIGAYSARLITTIPEGAEGHLNIVPNTPDGMTVLTNEAYRDVRFLVGTDIDFLAADIPESGTPVDLRLIDQKIFDVHYLGEGCPEFEVVWVENAPDQYAYSTVANDKIELYTEVITDWGSCTPSSPPAPQRIYFPNINN